MRRRTLHTSVKKLISITMIIIIIYTILNTIFNTKSYAAQSRDINANNIYNINETLYPGYASLLQNLKNTHPNWTFTLFYTDLDWSDVLRNETIVDHSRSLVQGKTGEWLCTHVECDGKPHDGTTWFGASQTAVAYYLDPRNFLTEDSIFQFETLSYIPSIHNEAGVEAILKGTFMSNKKICDYYGNSAYGDKTFAQTIMYAAEQSNVSPYHLASRVRQEVGVNGSGSSSGQVSGYVGYFNFYNIGAYAGGDAVINGLKYAQNAGWDTPEKSIVGGANWIANGYISKGQDSLYLQKWDVDSKYYGLYGHQYQQNIQAPASESGTIRNSYKAIFNNDLTNTSFNFVIPMYKNMPRTASRYPSSSTFVSQNAQLNDYIGAGVCLRATPNGELIKYLYNGASFLRIELKASNAGSNNWDKVMLPDGTMGYIATQFIIEASGNEVSKTAYINVEADLYNGPRTGANGTTAFRTLYKYQPVTIVEDGKYTFDGYTWVKVRLADGTNGYLPKNYVTEGTIGEQVKITCDTELAIRTGPGLSYDRIKYIDIGVIVTRIEKASTKVDGYYWDKVITDEGILGYMAREKYNPYLLYLTPVNGGTTNPPATGEKIALNEDEKIIKVIPYATFADIQAKYSNATLVSGTSTIGTGAKVGIDGKEYTIIKLGDVNGDGKTNSGDYVLLKNHIMDQGKLDGVYYKAGDANNDTKTNSGDYVLIKNSIMSSGNITL